MKKYLIGSLLILGILKTQAQIVNQNRIQVPCFQFENFIYDARSAGLGDGGIAISPDANSGFLNPAKLPFLNQKVEKDSTKKDNHGLNGFAINYSPYAQNLIDGMNLFGVTLYHARKENDAFSLSIKYFAAGMVTLTDENAQIISTANSNEFALQGAYAKKLSPKGSLSVGIKYIYSNLIGKQSLLGFNITPVSAFAADIYYFHNGKLYNGQTSWLNYGASLTNIGGKVSYRDYAKRNFQPTTLRAGVAQHFLLGAKNRLALSADAYRLVIPTPPQRNAKGDIIAGKDPEQISAIGTIFESWGTAPEGLSETLKEINYCFGAELTLQNILSLRTGYFYQNKDKGNMKFFTLGLGIKAKKMELDLSYLLPAQENNPLAHTLRFSILLNGL